MTELLLLLPLILQFLIPLLQQSFATAPPPTSPTRPYIPIVPAAPPISRPSYYGAGNNYYRPNSYFYDPFLSYSGFGNGYYPGNYRRGNIQFGKQKVNRKVRRSLARVPDIASMMRRKDPNNQQKLQSKAFKQTRLLVRAPDIGRKDHVCQEEGESGSLQENSRAWNQSVFHHSD